MGITQRAIKLASRDGSELDGLTYENGEVYFDQTNHTLRLMDSITRGGTKLATQPWVQNNLNTVSQPMSLTSTVQSTNTTSGSLKVAGGAGIVKNLYVGGIFDLAGDATLHSNLTVQENLTVETDVEVQGSLNLSTVGVLTDFAVNTDKFHVSTVTGNTIIAGDLTLAFDKFLVKSATGNTDIAGYLKVNSTKFTVEASTGNTVVAGTLAVANDFAVATDKFTVNHTSGDTHVAGQLTLDKSLVINTNKFNLDYLTGDMTIAGDGSITGDLHVTGDLTVVGDFDLRGNITIGNANTDTVAFGADVISHVLPDVTNTYDVGSTDKRWRKLWANTADISGQTDVGGDFAVATSKFTVNHTTGNTVVAGTLGVTNDFAVATNKFTVNHTSGNTLVAGTLSVTSDLAIATNQFTVNASTGAASFNGNVVIEGSLTTKGASYQLSGASELSGPLISLHTGALISNDGFDIGVFYNYYDTSLKSGWFGRKNSSGYLEFLTDSSVSGGVFTGTYGTFKGAGFISTGDSTFGGDIAVNGGDITTTQLTASIFDSTPTTVNIGGNATTMSIAKAGGTTTVNSALVSTGNLTASAEFKANGANGITTTQTTFPLVNATATTVNFAGAATAINMGATTGTVTINNPTIVGTQTTQTLWNTTATTVNAFGAATTIAIGNSAGTTTVSGALTVTGALTESSSITLKENVNPITNALSLIQQLEGVTYDRKNGTAKNEAGLIAEAVDKVLPNIVKHDANGNAEGINYTKLTAYLIEAVKELTAKVDALSKK